MSEISDETIAAMKAAAEAATPGPWEWRPEDASMTTLQTVNNVIEDENGVPWHPDTILWTTACRSCAQKERQCGHASNADQAHIAACHPQAVLGLIEMLERAEKALHRAQWEAEALKRAVMGLKGV